MSDCEWCYSHGPLPEIVPHIEHSRALHGTVARLSIERDDLQTLFNESKTAIDRMKQALRRHKCQDPGYHLKDLYDLADRTVWVP